MEGLPLRQGGLVTVAVRDGRAWHVSSSLTRATARSTPTLSVDAARDRAVDAARARGPPCAGAADAAGGRSDRWQPVAGGADVPCVDGDFDGTIIGHEYTHMVTNRMIAGPDDRLTRYQARGMGEGWSDLVAMEYLFELGRRPKGDTPYLTGGYVTREDRTGIRNYDRSRST